MNLVNALAAPSRLTPARAPTRLAALLGTAALLSVLGSWRPASAAPALPTGGAVQAGSASIGAPVGFKLTIDQSSAKAVINWSSFSIGQGGQVEFNNGSGVTLNRVTGGGPLSQIDGALSATGSLFLINPNGVIVGKNGVINVGGSIVASTLDVTDSAFMAGGDLNFSGSSAAGVSNSGLIVSGQGDIALIGAKVRNDGALQAPGGDVALAAGHEVVLHDGSLDDSKLSVTIGGPGTSATNAGLIEAASVELRANGGNVYALAVNPGARIDATGVATKDGNVYLVAEGGQVSASGEIDAHHADGSGGLVETSGNVVDFTGLKVKAGTWLIDPVNLTVDAAAAATIDTNLLTTSVTLKTTAGSASGPGVQSSGAGDIIINSAIDWSTTNALTIDAYHSIDINAPITLHNSGQLALVTNDGGTGGDYFIAKGASIGFMGTPHSGESLFINGQFYSLIYSADDLPTGDGFPCCNYAVARSFSLGDKLYDHAIIGGYFGSFYFFGTFAGLGNTISDININDQGPADFQFSVFNGRTSKSYVGFFGQIYGSTTVRDLNLSNVNITAADGMTVGGLAGYSAGTISNVTVSGLVVGGSNTHDSFGDNYVAAGGLVGVNNGSIVGSSSSAAVQAGDGTAGGLVGELTFGGSISGSHATGDVTVGSDTLADQTLFAGGLVGRLSSGSVSASYATGAVTGGGGSVIGGFVGSVDNGTITTSYASGNVSQTAGGISGQSSDIVGGFAGRIGPSSTVSASYASGDVSTHAGPDASATTLAGGFVGELDQGSVTNAYALGDVAVTGATFDIVGGFAGLIDFTGSITNFYATGAVSDSGGVAGGLAGKVGDVSGGLGGGSITGGYWDKGTTGQATGFTLDGGTATNVTAIGGTTGISPFAQATYGALDFTNTWTLIPGSTRPLLRSEYSSTIVNAHQLQLMSLNLAANYTIAADIDASETARASGIWNTANGFVPVGGTVAAPFTGSLDGQGHAISNLKIIDTAALAGQSLDGYAHNGFVGLFGIVGASGVVQNLSLANATVTGGDGMLVGALAGAVEGAVKNDTSSGAVTVGNDLGLVNNGGYASAGGLVGDAGFAGSILNSSSLASVNGGTANAGGLVGTLRSGATVTGGSASGAVTVGSGVSGGSQADAGGLVGVINGFQFGGVSPLTVTITGSYANGAVTGGSFSALGGFVGQANHGAISTSFATGNITGLGDSFAGGFAGVGLNTTIATSWASGGVSLTAAAAAGGNNVAGGFIGDGDTGATITNSWAGGDVTVNGAGSQPAFAGGFFGELKSGGSVSGAYSTGAVTLNTAQAVDDVGGFGGLLDGSVTNFYATGPITSTAGTVGGLIGQVSTTGAASTGYWDEGTTGKTVATGNVALGGAVTNLVGVGGATGLDPYQQASYANFNFATGWTLIAGQTRPMLLAEYSTTITNAHQLQLMTLDLAAHYTVANDIDASETASTHGIWNPANAFVPVGSTIAQPFQGTFDGATFAISNLKILHASASPLQSTFDGGFTQGAVGLFGLAGSSSLLENVDLENVNITGGAGRTVGALVGDLSGKVVNSFSSGTVTVGDATSNAAAAAGGLVGTLGDGGSAGLITFSASDARVNGGDAFAGGLVGLTNGGSNVTYSAAFGDVTVASGFADFTPLPYGGGLVGFIQGGASNASHFLQDYATGGVTGGDSSAVGGFAGGGNFVDIQQSYATGNVFGSQFGTAAETVAGGFIGYMGSGSISVAFASGEARVNGGVDTQSAAGGFVGYMNGGEISDAYASGQVVGDANDNALGGFAGDVEGGGFDRILAIGKVTGAGFRGALVGVFNGDHVTGGYWDDGVSGIGAPTGNGASVDATDVADVESDPASYPQLDFNVWSIPSAGFFPQLYGVSHVLKLTPRDAEQTYGDYPIFTFDVLGLQGGDDRGVVSGGHAVVTDGVLSGAGFNSVGTDHTIITGASATGSTGAYRIIADGQGQLTIDPRPIDASLSGNVEKTYDGNTNATIDPLQVTAGFAAANGSNVSVLPGDDVSIDPGSIPTTGTYDTRNVDLSQCNATCIGVSASGFTASGADLSNYQFSGQSHDFIGTIDPAPLTLTAVTDTKTYDGTTASSGTPFATGLVSTDTLDFAAQEFDSKNAGDRTLNVTDFTVNDGNGGANYSINFVSASGTITPAPLTIAAVGDTKVYDGATDSSQTPDVFGLVGGDTVTNLSQVFDSKNAGSRTMLVNTFTINDGNSGGNYDVTLTDNDGEITPKPISASLIGTVEKTYDGNTSAPVTSGELTLPGAIAGDDVSVLVSVPGTYATRNAGSGIAVNISGLSITGGDAANYTFTDGASADVGVIDQAALTITAVTDTRVYTGDALSSGVPLVSGLVTGDSASGLSQVFDSKNAGSRTLSVNGFSVNDGNDGANYTVVLVSADGSITPAPLTIAAVGDTKVYDGTTASSATPDVFGLVGGDTASNLSQVFDSKNAGSRSTLVDTFTINDGNGGLNYTVTLTGNDGEITPRPLSASLTGIVERTYDATTDAPVTAGDITLVNAVPGDALTVSVSVPGTYATPNAGSGIGVTVSGLSVGGADAGNYTFTDGAAGNVGKIDPATLTLTAVGDTKVYDGTVISGGTPQASGLFGDDSVSGLSQAFDSKNAGDRTLSINGFSVNDGNDGANYTVVLVSADGSITPAPLTIAAVGDTKVYDGTTASSQTPDVFGLVGGDTASNLSQVFDSKNAGSRSTLVDTFTINDGNGGLNYTVTLTGNDGEITPRPLSASLTGIVERTYDATTDAPVTAGDITLVNAVPGDALTVSVSGPGTYATPNVGSGIGVTVSGLSVGGADAGNYTFTDGASGNVGKIDPATLTLTAVGDTKVYDGTVISGGAPQASGLFGDDSVSGLSQAFDSKNAGNRTLNVNGFSISDGNGGHNYTVVLVSAPGTITPATLTLTAMTDSKTYDGTTASGGAPTSAGLVEGDSIASLSQSFDTKNAGARTLDVNPTYVINDGNGGGNYTVVLVTADGEITPKLLTVTLVGEVRKIYDGTTNATLASDNYDLSGVVAGDTVALNDPTAGTYDTPTVGSGKTVTVDGLALSGADAPNYEVDAEVFGDVGVIVTVSATIQPQIVTEPPELPPDQPSPPPQTLSFAGLGGGQFGVIMVFPVGNDDNDKGPGDNLPITGAGNGDLWEGSDLGEKDKPK